MIYLDHAAATPMRAEVFEAMQPYFIQFYYNPSATYLAANGVQKALDDARSSIAGVIGSKPSETIFTAGGTEANNLAIHGVMQKYPDARVLVSSIEHESVLRPANEHKCDVLPVNNQGEVEASTLEDYVGDDTVLVSVMYANNEIGTVQPIRSLAHQIEKIRDSRRKRGIKLPLYLHTDACQASNYLDMHVARLGVDLMTINGGKMYGPKQSGVLYVGGRLELAPMLQGGGQERGMRSGTENVAQSIGVAKALEMAAEERHSEVSRLQKLQHLFFEKIHQLIPEANINGSRSKRLPNNIHITIPNSDNERLIFGLDNNGIMAAAGSACSASNDEASHVLKALGKTDDEARASLRFTMGRSTTQDDVLKTVETLAELLDKSV